MMRAYARLVVSLSALIPLAWIAAVVALSVALPSLQEAGSAPLDDLVTGDGGAALQQQAATRTFGFPLFTDTVVVQRAAGGLPPGTQQHAAQAALAVRRRDTPDLPGLQLVLPVSDSSAPLTPGARATTLLNYLFFADSVNLAQRGAVAQRYGARHLGGPRAAVVGVTGAAPARLAQFDHIQSALPIVEAASVALILLIVGLAFRSLGAPLVTLFAAAIAYLVADRVLPWASARAGASVPAEVEPILIVLLLGLVTDYSVFFLSEARRRLRQGQDRTQAVRGAIARTAPIVFTAGLIVAAGTGALVVGKLGFFHALGPGLALTTLIALVVSVTIVPALLGLFGERLFGRQAAPAARTAGDEEQPRRPTRFRALTGPLTALRRTRGLAEAAGTSRWRLVIARVASVRPVALAIAVVCVVGLGVLAQPARSARLGLDFIAALPPSDPVHQAAQAAGAGFAPGALAPTEIDLWAPGIAGRPTQLGRLEALVRRQPGVATVIGPGEQPPPPAPPVLVSRDGNAARLAVVLDSDPLGAPAIDRLRDLRRRLPALLRQAGLGAPRMAIGGETAVADETVRGVLSDLRRIGVVALLVNLLLLVLFLRALIAPLYLIAVSVLGLAASLGITTFVFQDLLGHDDLTYYVPFAAAVLLIALGSDYNVFVAGRIWEEARSRRLGEAIAVATPAAAKAVTVAGIALAASFALLVVVPLRSFREFAFIMTVGVLIDTFIVRSLLMPALTALFGEAAWWPGRRLRAASADEIVERVAERARLSRAEAELLTEGTLSALGARISAHERRQLARHLPAELRAALTGSELPEGRFDVDEFLARARDRAGGNGVSEAEMRDYASVVLTTLEETVPDDLAYVRAQLSHDYDPLFEAPDEAPAEATA